MNLRYLFVILFIVAYEVALLTLSVIWPHQDWVRLLFLLRVPILTGLFLFALPFIATLGLPHVLKNLFVLESNLKLLLVIILTCTASVVTVEVGLIGLNNSPRFADIKTEPETGTVSELAIGSATNNESLASEYTASQEPLPTQTGRYDHVLEMLEQRKVPEEQELLPQTSSAEEAVVDDKGFLLNLPTKSIAILKEPINSLKLPIALVLALPIILGSFLLSVTINLFIRFLVTILGLGLSLGAYIALSAQNLLTNTNITKQLDFIPGIGQIQGLDSILLAYLFVGVIVYWLGGLLLAPKKGKGVQAPALYFLLLTVTILCLFFGGVTFFFDIVRIPVFSTFVLLAFAMYILFRVDHFYEITELGVATRECDLIAILKERLKDNKKKNLVVVCAAGGGIQAAGWTAQVLKGLDDLLEKEYEFTSSIGLISSVSGGSVGTMHYLDAFDNKGNLDPDKKKEILDRTTRDSLSATTWGIVYIDLLRALGLPFLVWLWGGHKRDRGWALEQRLEHAMHNREISFKTWKESILKGKLPIPVFNATIAENGLRFLLSPITIAKSLGKKVVEFSTLYKDYDIRATTAARLSATFSYVSPICRNDKGEPIRHIADGGYFDNFGVFTSVEWLDNQILPLCKDFIDKVIILEIRSFPNVTEKEQKVWNGWQTAFLGPLQTLANVRTSTQKARNEKEIGLLKKSWKDTVDIHHVFIGFPSELKNKKGKFKKVEDPPLSWQLTKKQIDTIKKAWELIENEEDADRVIDKLRKCLV